MQLTQGLRRAAMLYPQRPATICASRVHNWSETADRVGRLASGFACAGLAPGERVAILALNSDRYIECYYAVLWAGCIAVPFNSRWAPAEIKAAIEDSRPAALLFDQNFATVASQVAASGLRVIAMDGDADGSPEMLIASSAAAGDRSGAGDDLAIIFYTGGTTGQSKGVMLGHRNLVVNFACYNMVAPHAADTVFLHTPPLFHLADASMMFGLTSLGATHVALPTFSADAVIDTVEQNGVNALFLVPTMIGMLCERLRDRPADLSGVTRLTYGASAISASVLGRAMTAFPNADFIQAYGQTELSPYATVLDHRDHLAGRLGSAGRAIPSVDLRIVDEQGAEVPLGTAGEVLVRGPGVMLGYWDRPEQTGAAMTGDWLKTGDAAYIDLEGYLYLVDRVKDMIVSGGENVYSAEVEAALATHPAVLQCAVIGVPDDRWGERVHAVLQVRPDVPVTDADLLEHCAALIANYKRPKSFDLRTTPLPMSGVGKILKSDLRRLFWADRDRAVG